MTEIQSTELIVIEPAKALQVFTDEAARKPILDAVKAKVDAFIPDVTTAKGRGDIKSFAYLIAQAKVKADKIGAEISAAQKELPKKIDAGRADMKSFLENLQKEVRKPLDEWEAEQAKIKAEEEARKAAEELAKQKEIDHESALVEHELFTIKKAEEKRLAEEAQAKRDEEIRKEAAENARIEAEKKAENERLASARREAEARLQAEQAEKDKIEAAAKAERERIAAAEQAERDRVAAVEAERKRIAKIESDKEADRLAREADETHKANIKLQAIAGIKALGFSEKAAISIIEAIELGVIPNVKIEF